MLVYILTFGKEMCAPNTMKDGFSELWYTDLKVNETYLNDLWCVG